MKKGIPNYGVDAVSGVDEGSHPSIDSAMKPLPGDNDGNEDESNYPHIEDFVKTLAHPHELHHAMHHIAKRLVAEGVGEYNSSSGEAGEDDSQQPHVTGKEKPVTMDDFHKLKKSVD